MPELRLPEVDLPVIGKVGGGAPQSTVESEEKKREATKDTKGSTKLKTPSTINTRIKVSVGRDSDRMGKDAPTLAELQKKRGLTLGRGMPTLQEEEMSWKRFPGRRMPGANMEGWKEIAKQMTKDMN